MEFEKARWRNRARMICELHILYADGVRQVVDSDSSWKTSTGPYLQNNICGGDTYDKQREIVGWEKKISMMRHGNKRYVCLDHLLL